MTLTKHTLCLIFALFTHYVYAQHDLKLINSGKIIQEAYALNQQQKYAEAAALYEQIGRNDTNFASAQYEEAFSLYQIGKYDTVIRICQNLIALDDYYEIDAYNLLGNALDEKKLNGEAIEAYKTAIGKFPKSYMLHFNLGVAYYRAHRTDEAYTCIKKTLELNPYHAGSHYFLGLINAQSKRWAPALLAFHTAQLLGLNTSTENKCLNIMINIAQGDYETDSIPQHFTEPEDPAFAKIDKLIESKIALNSEYKIVTKIDDKVMKQTQMMLETMMQSRPKSDNYFVQLYVPLFTGIMENDYLKTALFYPYRNVDNAIVTKWKSKSKKEIADYEKWATAYFDKISSVYTDSLNGKPKTFKRFFFKNNNIEVLGDFYDDKKQIAKGYWKIYHSNTILEAEGDHDESGKKKGRWFSYYRSGRISAASTYLNDKLEGPYKAYYENGNLKKEADFKDGLYEGVLKDYFENGSLKSEEIYKAGVQNGHAVYYHENGNKKIEGDLKNDKVDALVSEYDASGFKSTETTWKDAKKDGPFMEYFAGGEVKTKGAYKNNEPIGKYEYYSINGKLVKEGEFVDGLRSGPWKEFYDNGKLSIESVYGKGKVSGTETHYDEDGLKFIEAIYKDDKLTAYKFYNKSGEVIGESKEAHGEIDLKSYSPNGKVLMQGKMKKGQRDGVWNFYYENGDLKSTETYDNGSQSGPIKLYHKNGALQTEGTMKAGEWDGHYKKYFQNGKLQEEGITSMGKTSGDNYTYLSNGAMIQHQYYADGEENGWQQEFFPDGKLEDEYCMAENYMSKYLVYDTAGHVFSRYTCPTGTATMDLKYFNGKNMVHAEYKNGRIEGEHKRYFSNGQMESDAFYQKGIETGPVKSYFDNGKLNATGPFKYGKRDSIWNFYEDKGSLESKGAYLNNEYNGIWTWTYDNGKPEMVSKFKEGIKDSISVFYGYDGMVRIKLRFNNGDLVGYTYPGKDNKDVKEIPLPDETGKIIAYYPNGNKSFEGAYKKGMRNGPWLSYFSDGKVQYATNYVDGWSEGKTTYYYPDGKVEQEKEYLNDDLHGVKKSYDKSGQITKEENYYMGRLHGSSVIYTAGKASKHLNYYFGVLVSEK